MLNWPLDTAEDAEQAVAAAAAMVAEPIQLLDPTEPPARVRYASFSDGIERIDRVGLETDFAPVKRLRAERVAPGMLCAQDETVARMPQRAATGDEIAERQFAMYRQLQGDNLTVGGARQLMAQNRKEGVPVSLACANRLIAIVRDSGAQCDTVLDVMDSMAVDGMAHAPSTVQLACEALCAAGRLAAAVAVLRDATASVTPAVLATTVQAILSAEKDATTMLPADLSAEDVAWILERAGEVPTAARLYECSVHAASGSLQQAVALFGTHIASSVDGPVTAVETNTVNRLLQRMCAEALDDAGNHRLAVATHAAKRKLPLRPETYVALFDACRREHDARGVPYFAHMRQNGSTSPSALVAFCEFAAAGEYDAHVEKVLGGRKGPVVWKTFVDDNVARAAAQPAATASISQVLAGIARLAVADHEVALLVAMARHVTEVLHADPRPVCSALVECAALMPAPDDVDAHRQAVARIEDASTSLLRALLAHGVPSADDAERRTFDEAADRFGALAQRLFPSEGGTLAPLRRTSVEAMTRKSAECYVNVADASCLVRLATEPAAAAVVAKQMQSYDSGGKGGAAFVVGLETVLCACEDKANRSAVLKLVASWLRRFGRWFVVLPLSAAVAQKAAGVTPPVPAPAACVRASWWACVWATTIRAAGHKRVTLFVNDPAAAGMATDGFSLKPVIRVDDFVKRLAAK